MVAELWRLKNNSILLCTAFSKIFEKVDRSVIIQVCGISFLKTGTTFAYLKLERNFPVLKDWLKMWAKTSRLDSDSTRKSLEKISSHPEELLGFIV